MSQSLVFSIVGALVLGVAAWWVMRPLLGTGQRRAALLLAAGVLAASGVLYLALGEPDALDAHAVSQEAPELPALVAGLAARMAENPDDVNGWMLLGRSYLALGDPSRAQQAFRRARDLTGDTDAGVLGAWAEAYVVEDPSRLVTAEPLFARVLELDPTDVKGLWYSALAAEERGDGAQADALFVRLLALDPPAELRAAIESRRGTLATPGLAVQVAVAAGMTVEEGSTLFVYLRSPERPMPIAARRLPAANFPAQLRLTAADLLAGGPWPPQGALVLGARLSRTADRRSGDPFGEVSLPAGADAGTVLIDQRVP